MKHSVMIFISAFALLMYAAPVHAVSAVDCKVLLERPISTHYVQKVIDRAFAGLDEIRSIEKKGPQDDWAKSVQSAEGGLIDAQVQIIQQQNQLDRASACLNYDSALIECAIDEVRTEIKSQIADGSEDAIRALLQLLSFLNERRRQLLFGALDPLYSDPGWYSQFAFDPEDTKYDDEKLKTEGPLCPFTSDYAPAFLNGFGCDVPLLSQRTDYEPIRAEYESLSIIDRQIRSFQQEAEKIFEIQQQIDEIFGNQSTTPPKPPKYEHKTAYGCGWTGGYCSGEAIRRCATNAECANAGRCKASTKVCKQNRAIRCWDDVQCGNGDTCIEDDATLSTRSVRSPFSVQKDETALLMEFLGVRAAQEISREFRDDLKIASEFREDQKQEKEDRELDDANPFSRYFRQSQRALVRIWGRIQGRREAGIFPAAVDGQLQAADALTSLRAAVAKLAKLAVVREEESPTKSKGLRDFVMSYAYFLNRTCLTRPCSMILEQVMRITSAKECFPYTNGEFLADNDNPENGEDPRWKKCKEKAGIK